MEGISIDTSDLHIYELRVGSFMSGVERDEAALRQEGVLSAQKGGKAFTIELYKETCKEAMHKASHRPGVATLAVCIYRMSFLPATAWACNSR